MIFKGLWNSERVGGLKHVPFRVYAGLLMLCDDVGLFEANAAVIHGLLFSTTPDVRLADVNRALESIESADLVRLYEVRGKRYGCLWNYRQSKGLKRRRQEYPAPPPELIAWQSSTEVPHDADPPDSSRGSPPEQKGTEQNRTEPNGTEACAHGPVMAEHLVAYAWSQCGMSPRLPVKFTINEARSLLKGVGAQHDRSAVAALEYMAAQDPRTRWHEVKNPLGLLISLAQDHRDGIGKKPKTEFTTFNQWQQQGTEAQP